MHVQLVILCGGPIFIVDVAIAKISPANICTPKITRYNTALHVLLHTTVKQQRES